MATLGTKFHYLDIEVSHLITEVIEYVYCSNVWDLRDMVTGGLIKEVGTK